LWTWDHSTNWSDDPTRVESGCFNKYRKEPTSFVDDYRRLFEFAGARGIEYLMIAGMFRDSHGGEAGAHEFLSVAKANGIKVLAGFGVASYGGFYWEGDHEWNLDTWLRKHPELEAVIPNPPIKPHAGMTGLGVACPVREETIRWYEDGTRWLLNNFDVAGIYLETGDYGICQCETCLARSDEREHGKETAREAMIDDAIAGRVSHDDMAVALPPVIDAAFALRPDCDVVYATYSGFSDATLESPPRFVETIDERAICQWTLTGMPYPEPWSDNADLRPPTKRNIGYSHWGSQWGNPNTRHSVAIKYVRELCSRADRAGLEGVFIHGELSALESFAARMNYEALAYFTRNPQATLDMFATNALADEFGGADEAATAVTWMTEPADAETLHARRNEAMAKWPKMAAPADDRWFELAHLMHSRLF